LFLFASGFAASFDVEGLAGLAGPSAGFAGAAAG
jgi:hypothetical protein